MLALVVGFWLTNSTILDLLEEAYLKSDERAKIEEDSEK